MKRGDRRFRKRTSFQSNLQHHSVLQLLRWEAMVILKVAVESSLTEMTTCSLFKTQVEEVFALLSQRQQAPRLDYRQSSRKTDLDLVEGLLEALEPQFTAQRVLAPSDRPYLLDDLQSS